MDDLDDKIGAGQEPWQKRQAVVAIVAGSLGFLAMIGLMVALDHFLA